MTNKLPQGWVECELKDIAEDIISGTGFPKMYQGNDAGDYPFAKVGDISKLYRSSKKIIDSAENYISEDIKNKIKGKVFPLNTIVFPKIGEALKGNYRLITKRKMLFDNNVMGIYLSNNVDILFLYYFLTTQDFGRFSVATTVPSIQKGNIEKIKINLPPLNEQKRIVEKIEEEFGKIDEGVEKLKSAQEQIKQYRQSVLNQQFKIKHAETLTLNDVTTKINDGTHKTPIYVNVGIPFISVKDIKNKQIYFDNCKFITKEEHEVLYKRCNPEKGDVLITKSGTIGRTAVVDTDIIFDLFVSVALLKPQREKITSEFLMYTLDNYISHIDVKQDVKGGLIKNLHIEDIKKIKINLPTLDEQKQIVKEIEKRFEVADEVEKIITENLEKAEQLKQSILKKAFEGRLVRQDPTDEPASELLAKIQAERNK